MFYCPKLLSLRLYSHFLSLFLSALSFFFFFRLCLLWNEKPFLVNLKKISLGINLWKENFQNQKGGKLIDKKIIFWKIKTKILSQKIREIWVEKQKSKSHFYICVNENHKKKPRKFQTERKKIFFCLFICLKEKKWKKRKKI